MKYFFLAMLLASVCCVVIPVDGQPTREKTRDHKIKAERTQTPKIDGVNVDTVNVAKLNVAEQSQPAGKADENKTDSQSYFRRLFAPESLPNLILCVVGIAGVIAAFYTFRVIREQTDASKQAVLLQKAGMQQWVDIKNWSAEQHKPPSGYVVSDGKAIPQPDTVTIGVFFEVVNSTNLPLTYRGFHAEINGQNTDSGPSPVLLPPKNERMQLVSVVLRGDQVAQYFTDDGTTLTLIVLIFFEDVFKEFRLQSFGQTCIFHYRQTSFVPYHGMLPQAVERDQAWDNRAQTKHPWWQFWKS